MNTIPVCFRKEMVCAQQGYSPSPSKPIEVLRSWTDKNLPIRVINQFPPATARDLGLAHTSHYVRGVMLGDIQNGHGTFSRELAISCKYTVGSMMMAVGIAHNMGVACSTSSGFHHAYPDHGGGFCTFNGLIVAARHALNFGMVQQVSILDLDVHFGDGTEACIDRLEDKNQIRAGEISQKCFSDIFGHGEPVRDKEFSEGVERIVQFIKDSASNGNSLLLYQAGADPHINDPLGGKLTSEQMRTRDRVVFETCKENGLPVVWNLAGGYQTDQDGKISPVIDLHLATMEECVRVYCD